MVYVCYKTTRPIQHKFYTKLAELHRSNIGLLPLRFFYPFQDYVSMTSLPLSLRSTTPESESEFRLLEILINSREVGWMTWYS